ncbi:MAG: hypothetical protein RR615_17245, partial [Morganella sp. (in: enterobacteria)]
VSISPLFRWPNSVCHYKENLIKGGLSGLNVKGKRSRTRSVTGIDGDIRLNKALWVMTEKMYEHFGNRQPI